MDKKTYVKLTEETRTEFVSLFTAKAMQDFIAITKNQKDADAGTFKVVISSDDEDRQGEKVNQEGLDFKNYMTNPVVLWGHDYYNPPIGVCTGISRDGNKTLAEGKFAPTPFAQQIRQLYEAGVVRATSIGFIPRSFDDAGNTLTAEVLEFSFVDIPANPVALSRQMISQRHLNPELLKIKGLTFSITEEFLPETKTAMSELFEKLKNTPNNHLEMKAEYEAIAEKYTKSGKFAPSFEKAIEIAALAIKSPCKAYFEAQSLKFELDIKGVEEGADCQLDDGTPGVMSRDPKNPDGALTCIPVENAGAKKADGSDGANEQNGGKVDDATGDGEHDVDYSEPSDELDKSLAPEHEKHLANHTKAIEEFKNSIDAYNADKKGILSDAHSELKEAIDDEHDRHEMKVNKAIDEFTKACMESIDEFNEGNKKSQTNAGGNTDNGGPSAGDYPHDGVVKAIEEFKSDVNDEHDRHRDTVQKAAKEHGMKMREAKPEQVDDKHQAFMKAVGKEHEKHVDVIQKSIEEFKEALEDTRDDQYSKGMKAARLSKSTREKLKTAMDGVAKSMSIHKKAMEFHKSAIEDHEEAMESHRGGYEQAKSAHAALKALVQDGGEEGSTPEDQGKEPTKTQRSDPSGVTPTLEQFLASGQLLKSQATAISGVLEKWNQLAKDVAPRNRK